MHAEYISCLVDVNIFKIEFSKTLCQPCRTRAFAKWWSGNSRELHLPMSELGFLGAQPCACGTHFRPCRQPGNFLLQRGRIRLARTRGKRHKLLTSYNAIPKDWLPSRRRHLFRQLGEKRHYLTK